MESLLICVTAFAAAVITLFSGFGLGTTLMPVIAIFFPVPVAVAMTAVVHLLNNLFKLALLWRGVDRRVLLAFGVPALVAAVPGALLLDFLSVLAPILRYQLWGHEYSITPVKATAGALLIVFATAEIVPFLDRLGKSRHSLPLGGILSGFFGGLSGNQGAFRSAFLIRAGLNKEAFVSTNAAIASLVDCSRLLIYGLAFEMTQGRLITLATVSAFLGVFLGRRLLRKVTIGFIQKLVAGMLYLLGALLCLGVV